MLFARHRRVAVACVVSAGCALGAAPAAWAGTAVNASPDIPNPNGPVTVGQTVPSTLTVQNDSTAAQASQQITVVNDSITLVPSCGTIPVGTSDCPSGSVDPGVFSLSGSGTGESGTACAGMTFTIVKTDPLQGKYQFREPAGTSVVLGNANAGGPASRCVIDFTTSVLMVPTHDARPDTGVQTDEVDAVSVVAADGQPGSGIGTNFTTVGPATPTLNTSVAPTPITLGHTFTDTATLTGATGAPAPTGTVTFNVYTNASCGGPPAYTSTAPVSTSNGATTATSAAIKPTDAGPEYVVASYSGDTEYTAVTAACGAPNEQASVTPATPAISTQVGPKTLAVGATFNDTATLTWPDGTEPPTGTVTFKVYGPKDSSCTKSPVFTSTTGVNSAGTAVSAPFAPRADGTYRVVASYGGDANYASSTSLCGDAAEEATVTSKPGDVGGKTAGKPRLKLVKRARPGTVLQGKDVTFTMTVTNVGVVAAKSVELCDQLPSGITLVSLGGGTLHVGELCWALGTLPARAHRTESFVAKVDVGIPAKTLINHAVATANGTPPAKAKAKVHIKPVRRQPSGVDTVTG